jgi:hypothetical protein
MQETLRLTRSQQMALLDILLVYVRLPDEPQEFVDVLRDVTTTTGELLQLIGNAIAEKQHAPKGGRADNGDPDTIVPAPAPHKRRPE